VSGKVTPFVPGLAVGHGQAYGGHTGCTVVLGPFRGAVEVRGLATGTRELDALSPHHLVPRADAVLLTGGSAFGLAAADGVMTWLEAKGRGYDTGVVPVPIVPAAVIFDLQADAPRPDAETGDAACEDARESGFLEGRIGAGSGATVGKIAGRERSMPGGFGAWSAAFGEYRVGALVVVNALGDVVDAEGRIVAGARGEDGGFLDAFALLRTGGVSPGEMGVKAGAPEPGTNTTLALVATDAPLGKVDLGRVARMAANAVTRRISPVHTPFDGDVVFAVSTAVEERAVSSREVLALGAAAQGALEVAILRAVTEGPR
jgi:L-aminopeptidase/D-esterase-like protein